MDFKRFAINLLAYSLRRAAEIAKRFFRRLNFLAQGFVYIGRIFFKLLVFPAYKAVYYAKYKLFNIYAPAKSKIFYFANKSYLIHVIMSFVGLAVVMNSLNAKELREENFGDKTIIYSVISKEELETLTEEMQGGFYSDKILSYLDKSAAVESQKSVSGSPESGYGEPMTDFSTTTEGGAAMVKPNIIEPVKIEDLPDASGPKQNGIFVYTVQEGETISSIAAKFNVSVETILWQNGLTARSLIKAGNKLEILPVSGVVHKVKSGENVSVIAKKYGIDQNKIISINNLFDAKDIKIGQKLIVPGGKQIIPVTASKPKYADNQIPTVSPISKLFIPPAEKLSAEGMLWPTTARRISQYYSWRHLAIDIAGPKGTPLIASDAGTVIFSGWLTGYGNNVLIDHGNGVKTRYAHSSKLYVEKGDQVVKGQTIAAMGSTGWSTGNHIHFEIIVNGVKKNPLAYVK